MQAAPDHRKHVRLFEKWESRQKVILFADVVGSARLFKTDDDEVIRAWLSFVDYLKEELLPDHDGRLVKTMGDGILAEIDDATLAVRFAMALSSKLDRVNRQLPPDHGLQVRIGIDAGDVITPATTTCTAATSTLRRASWPLRVPEKLSLQPKSGTLWRASWMPNSRTWASAT